jgi:hypothetical protein
VARSGGPGKLVHYEGIHLRERFSQSAQVLVVVERVASCPVNEADVGVVPRLAVVAVLPSRVQQHVRNARHGDEVGDTVAQCR